jgi:ATP-dependent protease Clp, ATPase subunit
LKIDSVDLSFREEALKSIAQRAIARKTGARGLRSILEDILMDVMFELPNEDLEKVIIDENSADNGSEPIKVFKTPKKKSSAS